MGPRIVFLAFMICAAAISGCAQSFSIHVIDSRLFSDPERGIRRFVDAISAHRCERGSVNDVSESLKRAQEPIINEIRDSLKRFQEKRGILLLFDLSDCNPSHGCLIEGDLVDDTSDFIEEFKRADPDRQSLVFCNPIRRLVEANPGNVVEQVTNQKSKIQNLKSRKASCT